MGCLELCCVSTGESRRGMTTKLLVFVSLSHKQDKRNKLEDSGGHCTVTLHRHQQQASIRVQYVRSSYR